jgi:anion-transporting  ArsA/GET3 family ATPase
MPSSVDIASLLQTKRVLLVVGAGGVGKTTLSAVLGVAAAQHGKRVLVLTVDPARRLANALGLQRLDGHVQRLDAAAWAAQGCAVSGSLDAAMLDVKATFDGVIARYAKTPASARRILEHPFYQQASTALAGAQEYMATERLYECVNSGDYDLVVLDTPPAEHALDFIDAPRRLIALFESPAFRKLVAPSGALRSGMFRPTSLVMKGLSRFTSMDMFANLLEFFSSLAETFDGFVARAQQVQTLLHSDEAAFIVVSACDGASIGQAKMLLDHLRADGLHPEAWLVNRALAGIDLRLTEPPATLVADVAAALEAAGPDASGGDSLDAAATARRLVKNAQQLALLAEADQQRVDEVRALVASSLHVQAVPRQDDEPDSLTSLAGLATVLTAAREAA